MKVFVYRATRRAEMFVYLLKQDDFSVLPEELLRAVGKLEPALSFDLTAGRKLARVDAETARQALKDQGYFVQLPPQVEDYDALYDPFR
ncbi:MAG: YcgL domain-containing protein [Thioalkalivibrionaceae bacterium]